MNTLQVSPINAIDILVTSIVFFSLIILVMKAAKPNPSSKKVGL
jgi:hypothetical protein